MVGKTTTDAARSADADDAARAAGGVGAPAPDHPAACETPTDDATELVEAIRAVAADATDAVDGAVAVRTPDGWVNLGTVAAKCYRAPGEEVAVPSERPARTAARIAPGRVAAVAPVVPLAGE